MPATTLSIYILQPKSSSLLPYIYYYIMEKLEKAILTMARRVHEVILFLFLVYVLPSCPGIRRAAAAANKPPVKASEEVVVDGIASYCLSWRLAVEANNMRPWRTVPTQCLRFIETYMVGGQYEQDVSLIVDEIMSYARGIVVAGDGRDAWVLDVDDTCISNLFYYKGKRFGCDPYDPMAFVSWARKGGCPAIAGVLGLFNMLVESGFKVFLVTGRDEAILRQATIDNLHNQGFMGYERLILRTGAYKGKSAVAYKSDIRKQIMEQGYRIWGNVGDQWSDLQGHCLGKRTFKLPNPMYFVP